MLNMQILLEELQPLCSNLAEIPISGAMFDAIVANAVASCKVTEDKEKPNEHPEPSECPIKEE